MFVYSTVFTVNINEFGKNEIQILFARWWQRTKHKSSTPLGAITAMLYSSNSMTFTISTDGSASFITVESVMSDDHSQPISANNISDDARNSTIKWHVSLLLACCNTFCSGGSCRRSCPYRIVLSFYLKNHWTNIRTSMCLWLSAWKY